SHRDSGNVLGETFAFRGGTVPLHVERGDDEVALFLRQFLRRFITSATPSPPTTAALFGLPVVARERTDLDEVEVAARLVAGAIRGHRVVGHEVTGRERHFLEEQGV